MDVVLRSIEAAIARHWPTDEVVPGMIHEVTCMVARDDVFHVLFTDGDVDACRVVVNNNEFVVVATMSRADFEKVRINHLTIFKLL